MHRKRIIVAVALAILLSPLAAALAQHEHHQMGAVDTSAFVRNLEFSGDRVAQLAGAIPEDAYGWRPMEGVRSVSETIMHVAGANYFFAGRLGAASPEGVDPSGFEEITDKAECIAALEASIDHLADALFSVEDPHAAMEVFGEERTVEDLMLIAIGHVHEHLGQLIAYARSNQVVPPWSQ